MFKANLFVSILPATSSIIPTITTVTNSYKTNIITTAITTTPASSSPHPLPHHHYYLHHYYPTMIIITTTIPDNSPVVPGTGWCATPGCCRWPSQSWNPSHTWTRALLASGTRGWSSPEHRAPLSSMQLTNIFSTVVSNMDLCQLNIGWLSG